MSKQIAGATSKLIIHYPTKLWLGNLSKKFPYLQIQINAFVPLKTDPFVGQSLIEIQGENPHKIIPFLENQASLIAYSIMKEDPVKIILSTQTKDQFLLRAIVKNGILVSLPVKVYNGKAEFIVNGTRDAINGFITDLNQKGLEVEILSLGRFSKSQEKLNLTSRQYEIYQKAREAGYYDSPRKITLTELADELDIAKSSLSSMFQRIHNRLLGVK